LKAAHFRLLLPGRASHKEGIHCNWEVRNNSAKLVSRQRKHKHKFELDLYAEPERHFSPGPGPVQHFAISGEQKSSSDTCNRLIDYGFQLGKWQTSQTVPKDRLFHNLLVPELRKQIMQDGQNVRETTLKKFRLDQRRLLIQGGSYLMTPFLDFILIHMYTTHVSHDYILYDSTEVTEATIMFDRTTTAKTLESLHTKEMKFISVVGENLSDIVNVYFHETSGIHNIESMSLKKHNSDNIIWAWFTELEMGSARPLMDTLHSHSSSDDPSCHPFGTGAKRLSLVLSACSLPIPIG
jgi:hypothetical protein